MWVILDFSLEGSFIHSFSKHGCLQCVIHCGSTGDRVRNKPEDPYSKYKGEGSEQVITSTYSLITYCKKLIPPLYSYDSLL